jgi:hypothetical protein
MLPGDMVLGVGEDALDTLGGCGGGLITRDV